MLRLDFPIVEGDKRAVDLTMSHTSHTTFNPLSMPPEPLSMCHTDGPPAFEKLILWYWRTGAVAALCSLPLTFELGTCLGTFP